MKIQNNYCCGSHCRDPNSEVRVMPIGGGGNLILCRECWDYENRWRKSTSRVAHEWYQAEVYDGAK